MTGGYKPLNFNETNEATHKVRLKVTEIRGRAIRVVQDNIEAYVPISQVQSPIPQASETEDVILELPLWLITDRGFEMEDDDE